MVKMLVVDVTAADVEAPRPLTGDGFLDALDRLSTASFQRAN